MKFELKDSFTNIAYDAVINSLADSLTFRELCGTESENKTRERIHVDTFAIAPIFGDEYVKGEIEKILPCAVICTSGYGSSFGREESGVGSFHATGRIAVSIYIPVPQEFVVKAEVTPEGIRIIESIAGKILMEMERLTKVGGKQYLYFESCRLTGTAVNPPEQQVNAGTIAVVNMEFNY